MEESVSGAGVVHLSKAFARARNSRLDIAGLAAVVLTPEVIMAQSLQRGFDSPKGLTTQSPQYSPPQRRQIAVADSKL